MDEWSDDINVRTSRLFDGISNVYVRSLQDYEVFNWEFELGKGGFATVFKAQCKSTGRYVAVKRVKQHK